MKQANVQLKKKFTGFHDLRDTVHELLKCNEGRVFSFSDLFAATQIRLFPKYIFSSQNTLS